MSSDSDFVFFLSVINRIALIFLNEQLLGFLLYCIKAKMMLGNIKQGRKTLIKAFAIGEKRIAFSLNQIPLKHRQGSSKKLEWGTFASSVFVGRP